MVTEVVSSPHMFSLFGIESILLKVTLTSIEPENDFTKASE